MAVAFLVLATLGRGREAHDLLSLFSVNSVSSVVRTTFVITSFQLFP